MHLHTNLSVIIWFDYYGGNWNLVLAQVAALHASVIWFTEMLHIKFQISCFLALRGREIAESLNTADSIRPSVACSCRFFSHVEIGKILMVVLCSSRLSNFSLFQKVEVLNKPFQFVVKSKHKTLHMMIIPGYYRKIYVIYLCLCFLKNI